MQSISNIDWASWGKNLLYWQTCAKPPPQNGISLEKASTSWQVLEWIGEDSGNPSNGPAQVIKCKSVDWSPNSPPKPK